MPAIEWARRRVFFLCPSTLIYREMTTLQKKTLKEAVFLAKELGVFNLIWISPEDMTDLCVMAVEVNIDPEYIFDFVQKLRIPASDGARRLESWPWPVSIHVLEGYIIRQAHQIDPQSHKARQKPLELLRSLVDAGPRGRSVPYLIDLLWPDNDDEKKSRNTFYITVHRLRQLLGSSDTVVLTQGRFAINRQIVYVDVWELRTLLGRAESLKDLSSPAGEELMLRIEKMWDPVEIVPFENGEETWVELLSPRIESLRLRPSRERVRNHQI
jgi:hypothetical protein